MRTLVLMRGAPACGKSEYIKAHGWEEYTLEADKIRAQLGYEFTTNSSVDARRNERLVWDILKMLLEKRMQKGMFTVIDATHMRGSSFNVYKPLIKKYRYRAYCIDLSDTVSEAECLRRNMLRPPYKQVPPYVIKKAFAREDDHIPSSYITTLAPDEVDKLQVPPWDVSNYKNIKVIGDIHSCATVLKKALGEYSPDTLYVFCGDYFDRGNQVGETIEILSKYLEQPNTIFIEGNHEEHLRKYCDNMESGGVQRVNEHLTVSEETTFGDIAKCNTTLSAYAESLDTIRNTTYSRLFAHATKPYLDEHKGARTFVRHLCSKLWQCAYLQYHDKTLIITHGGIAGIPECTETDRGKLYLLSTYQLIHGTGNYEDVKEIDTMFSMSMPKNVISIHGHRNPTWAATKTAETAYNLEAAVGNGGALRWLDISYNDGVEITCHSAENADSAKIINTSEPITDVETLISRLREMRAIVTEKEFKNIHSFNFNEYAFRNSIWNDMSVKARGLFINVSTNQVVARSYDKFFNFDENKDTGYFALGKTLKFPVTAYVKENGHLGILGYDSESDTLIFATKSAINSPMTRRFEWFVKQTANLAELKEYIKENNVSLIFEIVDMEEDPHIISYAESKLVLLDVVKNDLIFQRYDYDRMVNEVANHFGFEPKKIYKVFNTLDDLFYFIKANEADIAALDEEFLCNPDQIEGVVLQDANDYMFKLKFPYYRFWKHLRSIIVPTLNRGEIKYQQMLYNATAVEFYKFLQKVHKQLIAGENTGVSGIDYSHMPSKALVLLREEFLKQK